jgi:AcrR family transcriptional regulator
MAPRPSPELAGSEATKGERTRQRLLTLAIDHFGARGYRSTSVSEIARAAGLTQATAYAYFDNKQSLFVAAVDADATKLILTAHATLTEHLAVDRFRAFLAALYLGLDSHPLARRVLDGGEPDVLPRLGGLPALRLTTALIVSDLQAGQADGNIRQDVDILALGDGIEAIILGLLVGAVQSGGSDQTRYRLGVDAAFDAMLRPLD